MPTEVQMLATRPDGAGGTYKAGTTYIIADDLAGYFISTGVARRTTAITEDTAIPAKLSANGKKFDPAALVTIDPASGAFLSGQADAVYARQNARRRLSTMMQSQIYGNITAQAQTATDFCYHMTVVIPTDARSFVVALDNASPTLPFRIKRAAIATSDSVGPDVTFGTTTGQVRVTPQNGSAWTPITWGGAANVEIDVAPSATRTTRKYSDKILCPTVANADGTAKRVVMLRFWVEGTTSSPGNGYNTGTYTQAWRSLAANSALHYGYLWQCVRSTVDGVSSPASFTPVTDLSALPFLTSIQYEAYVPGLVLNVFGDSTSAGAVNNFTGNFGNGWVWQALAYLRAKYPYIPIDLSNNGWAAKPSSVYQQCALDYITSGGVVGLPIYQPFSQNDGTPNASIIAAQKKLFAQFDAAIAALGLYTSVVTPLPNTGLAWGASADGIRLAYRQELLAMRQTGRTVIDMECLSDGATPARYRSDCSTDGAHPNEYGGSFLAKSGCIALGDIV